MRFDDAVVGCGVVGGSSVDVGDVSEGLGLGSEFKDVGFASEDL